MAITPTNFNDYLLTLSDNEIVQLAEAITFDFPYGSEFILNYIEALNEEDKADAIKYLSMMAEGSVQALLNQAEIPQQMKNDEKIVKAVSEAILTGDLVSYDSDRIDGMTLADLQQWIQDLISGLMNEDGCVADLDPDYLCDNETSYITDTSPITFSGVYLETNVVNLVVPTGGIISQFNNYDINGDIEPYAIVTGTEPVTFNPSPYKLDNNDIKLVVPTNVDPIDFNPTFIALDNDTRVVLPTGNELASFGSTLKALDNDTRIVVPTNNNGISFSSYKIEDYDTKIVLQSDNISVAFTGYQALDNDDRVVVQKDNTNISFNSYELEGNSSKILIHKDNIALDFTPMYIYELEDNDNRIIIPTSETNISFGASYGYDLEDNDTKIVNIVDNIAVSFNPQENYKLEDGDVKVVLPTDNVAIAMPHGYILETNPTHAATLNANIPVSFTKGIKGPNIGYGALVGGNLPTYQEEAVYTGSNYPPYSSTITISNTIEYNSTNNGSYPLPGNIMCKDGYCWIPGNPKWEVTMDDDGGIIVPIIPENCDYDEWVKVTSNNKAVYRSKEFICFEGQSEFHGVQYAPGFINVWLEGDLLAADDYEAKDGITVKLNIPCVENDTVYIQAFGAFSLADTFTKQEVLELLGQYKSAAPILSTLQTIGEKTTRYIYIKNFNNAYVYNATISGGYIKQEADKLIITAPDAEDIPYITVYVSSTEPDKGTSATSSCTIQVQDLTIIADDIIDWTVFEDNPTYFESYKNGTFDSNQFISQASGFDDINIAEISSVAVDQDPSEIGWSFAKATTNMSPVQCSVLSTVTVGTDTYLTNNFQVIINEVIEPNTQLYVFPEGQKDENGNPLGSTIVTDSNETTGLGSVTIIDVTKYGFKSSIIKIFKGNQTFSMSLAEDENTSFDKINIATNAPYIDHLEFKNLKTNGYTITDNMLIEVDNASYNISTLLENKTTNVSGTIVPHSTMQSSFNLDRVNSTAINYQDDIYLIGGNNGAIYYNNITKINPINNVTQIVTSLPEEMQNRIDLNVVERNSKLYLMGGMKLDETTGDFITDSIISIYDIHTDSWTSHQLPFNIKDYIVVEFDFKIYFIGGRNQEDNSFNTNMYVYDLKTFDYDMLDASVLGTRVGHCADVYQDTILVYGGFNENIQAVPSLHQFMIGNNEWISKISTSDSIVPGTMIHAKMNIIGNHLILNGGTISTCENTDIPASVLDKLYIWDMFAQQWVYETNTEIYAFDFNMVQVNEKLHIINGSVIDNVTGSSDINTNMHVLNIYDIYTNIVLSGYNGDYTNISTVNVAGDILVQQPVKIVEESTNILSVEYSGVLSQNTNAKEIKWQFKTGNNGDILSFVNINTYTS